MEQDAASPNTAALPTSYMEILLNTRGEKTLFGLPREPLERLIAARTARDEAARALRAAEEEVGEAARSANRSGDSWRVVGSVLGLSRQAAQQRYGRSAGTQTGCADGPERPQDGSEPVR